MPRITTLYNKCDECVKLDECKYAAKKQEMESVAELEVMEAGPIYISLGCRSFMPIIFRSHDHKEVK